MKYLVLVFFCAVFLNGFTQNKLSNPSQISLLEDGGLLMTEKGDLRALVLVNACASDSVFNANAITVNGKFGNIWSLQLPLEKLSTLRNMDEVEYIELATMANAARFKNDVERLNTSVDKVQSGLQHALPLNYSGKGVVVGIVDIGFQGDNPTFFNATGSKSRIVKWWQQSNKNGTPPVGFNYGTELSDSVSIISSNDNDGSHGTHVAGIAAGSGCSTPNLQYRGMAPEADLVFVSIKYANDTLGGSALGDYIVANPSILDAYQYIFNYAQSVGKPAVINLSWGMHTGPHDGNSLFDKATENLVGKGKVLVGANGNDGDNTMHWNYSFNNDTVSTIVIENGRQNRSAESVYADFWGSANSDFGMQVQILDTNKNLITQTPFISSASDKMNVFNLDADAGKFNIILACVKKNAINDKPNITLSAKHFNPRKYIIVLKITSQNSSVHGWNSGSSRDWTSGSFRVKVGNFDYTNVFIPGNTSYTNGENGGTSKAVISVGAMAARSAYTNYTGKLMNDSGYVLPGSIAKFSSKGPTVDGRVKPDIAAPGFDVPSSMNNKQFEGWMLERTLLKSVFRNDTNYWTALNGTSMASPHVCGIVALMLQANPALNAAEVLEILQQTATSNNTTGNVPNNQYGYGIVNAYEAVKSALKYVGISVIEAGAGLTLFPNPAEDLVTITFPEHVNEFGFELSEMNGKIIRTVNAIPVNGKYSALDFTLLNSGMYAIKVMAGGKSYVTKFIKN